MRYDAIGLPVPDLLIPTTREWMDLMAERTTPRERDRWVDEFMPILMTFILPGDAVVRSIIRGDTPPELPPGSYYHAVVQGCDEADRIARQWFAVRYARHQHLGTVARCRA